MSGWSFGGVVASALMGGIGAAGKAGAEQILEQQKQEAQRLREEQLAKLTLGNQKAMVDYEVASKIKNAPAMTQAKLADLQATTPITTQAEVDKYNAMTPGHIQRTQAETSARIAEQNKASKVVGADQTLVAADGTIIFQGEGKTRSQEELDLIREKIFTERTAQAKNLAEVEVKTSKVGAIGKNDMENFKPVEKDSNVQYDPVARIYRTYVEGSPGKPAKGGVLGFGSSDAVPEVKGGFVYFDESKKNLTPDEVLKKYPKVEDAANKRDSGVQQMTATDRVNIQQAVRNGNFDALRAAGDQYGFDNVDQIIKSVGGVTPQKGGPTASTLEPPPGAIAKLISNKSLASQFDAKYGPGASARYLRK